MLEVQIEKKLGSFHLSSAFEAGNEVLALLGASGSGKSVTLRCIAGIEHPDSGRIVLDGRVLFDRQAHIDLPPQQRRIGYLFQQYALFPQMTVLENIAVGARSLPKAARLAAARQKIRAFRLEGCENQYPDELSGGQQQRTALARMLMTEPALLLLDEPFSALDSYLKYELETELSDMLTTFPGTVLWVSHDRGEVYRNCSRVLIMEQGRSSPVICRDTLIHDPGTVGAAMLSGCKNVVPAEARDGGAYVPCWGLLLPGVVLPDGCKMIGIRAHEVRPATDDANDAIRCTVARAVEDVFSMIYLLKLPDAQADAPYLRMECVKHGAPAFGEGAQIAVCVRPSDVLYLRKN